MSINPLHFGCWNMRGLNDPIKQKEVRSFVTINKLSFLGLVEHKIKEPNASKILTSMLPFWNFVHNYVQAPNGRIIVAWDPTAVDINILDKSSQAIHCQVSIPSGTQFVATFVYGSNSYVERTELWNSLNSWRSSLSWIVLGDFNALRFPSDKVGGDYHWPPHMEDLNKCISHNDLDDLRYTGCHFTWANKLILSDDSLSHDPESIKDTFVEFYSNLLGTPHSTPYFGASRVDQLVASRLSDSQRNAMITDVTNQEIKEVFMALNPNKAPGPDGYNASFFHKSWDVVGHEVTSAVRNFFRSGRLLTRANATSIALVPKVPNPSKVGDYRPISCCNTIYKCIAKILSRRIQVALPHLIDHVQSGFVKGRRIADNIFLTQEIMRDYHKHSSTPKCALKVDIMKAYDNVRWDLLWDILSSMNFHPKMINWIKACVTTANYSLSINGESIGKIKGQKGLRQGDPLSSYLFVIVMEILTQLLREQSLNSNFHYHWRCDKTKIINLCFADDLMIFCKGELSSIQCIHNALNEFASLSGLTPSPGKSIAFFSRVPTTIKNSILQTLGFNEGNLPVKYLGVPLITTKLRYTDCQILIDRITSRTKSWANKYLSYAGRVQLVKSVLFSMQTYWSSIFILPKKVLKEVESILRAFFWTGPDLKHSGAKVSWEHLCSPRKEGGLGFKSLQVWNKAAMAKHIWYLVSGGEQSMWCQWVKSYLLKSKSFWKVKIPSSPSWTWRKLLQLRPLIHPFILYEIGDGSSTFLWHDNWHPLGPLVARFGNRIIYDSGLSDDAKVSTILSRSNHWKFPISQTWELNDIRANLPAITHPPLSKDSCRWTLSNNGLFTVSSLWEQLRTHFPIIDWSHIVWFPFHIPKCSLISWLAIQNRLATEDRLVLFGIKDTSCCSFCPEEEDHNHLFFNCPFTQKVWDEVSRKSHLTLQPQSLQDLVSILSGYRGKGLRSTIIKLSFTVTLYHIWIERNLRKFQNKQHTISLVVNKVCTDIRCKLLSLNNIPEGPLYLCEAWHLNS